jgi:hypothetical protein
VNTSVGLAKSVDRLTEIFKPSNALLLFDWNAGGVDLSLERRGSLELIPVPEFYGRKTEWKPFQRDRQARMHQNSADGVVAQTPFLVASAIDAFGEPNVMGLAALVGELSRVLQQQNGAAAGIVPRASGGEMPAQDIAFLHFAVREKPVGGFGVRPILAREWNRTAHTVAKLPQQIGETASKPGVLKGRLIDLLIAPMRRTIVPNRHHAPRQTNQVLDIESQRIHLIQHFRIQIFI